MTPDISVSDPPTSVNVYYIYIRDEHRQAHDGNVIGGRSAVGRRQSGRSDATPAPFLRRLTPDCRRGASPDIALTFSTALARTARGKPLPTEGRLSGRVGSNMTTPGKPAQRPANRNFYSIKMASANIKATVSAVEAKWNKFFPADPFNYFFLDESFDRQYKSDELFGSVFGLFSVLAILIACFGLAGLSAYNVLQRRKEIGIRKVMGATVFNLWKMLSKEFVVLVVISCLIAIPVALYLLDHWLQQYEYRTTISWWIFAVAISGALVLTLITVSFQAIRAAVSNPVKSLRTE